VNDFLEHITHRKNRYNELDTTNEKLLGLATVEINPTELCNRKCSFCPRVDPDIYPNRNLHMSVATAETLSKQLLDANYSGDIHITGWGEPTLNPHILEIIDAFSKNFHTEMITNGDRLLNGKLTHQELSAYGLSHIIIDCYDGPEQTKAMTELMSNFVGKCRIRNNYDTGESNLLEVYDFNNRGGTMGMIESLQQQCWMPMYKAFIDWDGGVGLCCNDWARKQQDFGNINTDTFNNIWMSAEFMAVRKELLLGNRSNLPACSGCNTNGCKSGEESANIWNENIHRT